MLLTDSNREPILGKWFDYHPYFFSLSKIKRLQDNGSYKLFQRFVYDNQGNISTTIDAEGHKKVIRYEEPGGFLPTQIEQKASGDSPLVATHASYNYASGGQIKKMIDPNKHESSVKYDGLGRMKSLYLPGDGDIPSYNFSYSFGNASALTTITTQTSHMTKSSVIMQDGLLRKVASFSPTAQGSMLTELSIFNLDGSIDAKSSPQPIVSVSATRIQLDPRYFVKQTWDQQGRLTSSTKATYKGLGTAQTTQDYEILASKNRMIISSPEGRKKATNTDPLGRITSIEQTLNDTFFTTVLTNIYTPSNKIEKVILPNKTERQYVWDTMNRLESISAPEVGKIAYEYAPDDQIIAEKRWDRQGNPQVASIQSTMA